MTRAFITGVTGQDGYYLSRLLLGKGYEVHGSTRDAATAEVLPGVVLHEIDATRPNRMRELVIELSPQEIYNLAAQSHVGASFQIPIETVTANTVGVASLLEAVRELDSRGRRVRLFEAASSEIFGSPATFPQTEATPFHPRNPYACSKVCAFHLVVNYREAYNLFACNGILYNHESPRRPAGFVTRKITQAAVRIAAGLDKSLTLGNLDVGRDWGSAEEYVQAMWQMLQVDEPDDFIIATNEWHTLEEFLTLAFSQVNLDWHDYVQIDPAFIRPVEVTRLQGDYSKAAEKLGWQPHTKLPQLIEQMCAADRRHLNG